MAKKERQKRAARQARQQEREELAAVHAVSNGGSAPDPKAASKKEGAKAEAAPQAKPAAAKEKKADKGKKPGLIQRQKNYFAAVRTEMHRVIWPSRDEERNYSVAVIVSLVVFGVAVWAVDTGFIALISAFTGLRG